MATRWKLCLAVLVNSHGMGLRQRLDARLDQFDGSRSEVRRPQFIDGKLGPARFWRQLDSEFPSIFMTLTSIIQGLALGVLVAVSASLLQDGTQSETLMHLAALWGPFLLIIYVWSTYVYASLAYRYEMLLMDAAIPFSIGLAQCFLILVVRTPWAFLTMAAVIALLGLLDTFRMRFRITEVEFESREYFQLEVDSFWESLRSYGIAMILFGIAALLCLVVDPVVERWLALLPAAFMTVLVVMTDRSDKAWLRSLMAEEYGDRPSPDQTTSM